MVSLVEIKCLTSPFVLEQMFDSPQVIQKF